jgi:hypothetical protein
MLLSTLPLVVNYRALVLALVALLFLLAGCTKTREVIVEQTVVVRETVVVTPQAGFQKLDVILLAEPQIAEQGGFPRSQREETFLLPTRWVRCVDASYRSGNRLWIVTCEFRVERDSGEADVTGQYVLDDETGKLAR